MLPPDLPERPAMVSVAAGLLLASAAILLLSWAVWPDSVVSNGARVFFVMLWALLAYAAYRGLGWVRFAIGLIFVASAWGVTNAESIAAAISDTAISEMVCSALQVAAPGPAVPADCEPLVRRGAGGGGEPLTRGTAGGGVAARPPRKVKPGPSRVGPGAPSVGFRGQLQQDSVRGLGVHEHLRSALADQPCTGLAHRGGGLRDIVHLEGDGVDALAASLEGASNRSVRIRGGDDFDETAVGQIEEGLLDAEGLALVDAVEGESERIAIGLDAVVEIGNPHHQGDRIQSKPFVRLQQ